MPRPRKTESQRRAELFRRLYKVGKGRIDATEELVANAVGVGRPALKNKRDNPGRFVSLDDLVTFGKIFGWTDEDVLSIYHAEKVDDILRIHSDGSCTYKGVTWLTVRDALTAIWEQKEPRP